MDGGGASSPRPSEPGASPAPSAGPTAVTPLQPPLVVPNIIRSASNTTSRLLEILAPLADKGVPLEQALVLASAPFPVAGQAWFSHDWGYPRYVPYPHLHEGTDIFADFGTPIVASGGGTVLGMGVTPIGGFSIWVAGDDAAGLYYAHLLSFAEGLQVGQRVESGTVIGYVGNSGNAAGTPPHLHFEIHPATFGTKGKLIAGGVTTLVDGTGHTNTPAADPKPYLDEWLKQAEVRAQTLVAELGLRYAIIAREVYFARRVQSLYEVEETQPAENMMWLSFFQPTLGALGIAQHAAADLALGTPGSLAERSARDRMIAEVQLAVRAHDAKLSALTGSRLLGL